MRIAMLGATRGSGLEALLLLLERGGADMEVHALVRNEAAFRSMLASRSVEGERLRQVHIFTGDAMKADSVKAFFQTVAERGHIDHVISSLGVLPEISMRTPWAIKIMPAGTENLCCESMANILAALEGIAGQQGDKKAPNLVVVSANGIGQSTFKALPFVLKPLYSWFLKQPHADKHKMEELLHKRYNIASRDFNPSAVGGGNAGGVLDKDKLSILRPSIFTDGERTNKVRSSLDTLPGAWTVSRKDVGSYIVTACLNIDSGLREEKLGRTVAGAWQGGRSVSY